MVKLRMLTASMVSAVQLNRVGGSGVDVDIRYDRLYSAGDPSCPSTLSRGYGRAPTVIVWSLLRAPKLTS